MFLLKPVEVQSHSEDLKTRGSYLQTKTSLKWRIKFEMRCWSCSWAVSGHLSPSAQGSPAAGHKQTAASGPASRLFPWCNSARGVTPSWSHRWQQRQLDVQLLRIIYYNAEIKSILHTAIRSPPETLLPVCAGSKHAQRVTQSWTPSTLINQFRLESA